MQIYLILFLLVWTFEAFLCEYADVFALNTA